MPVFLVKLFNVLPLEGLVLQVQLVVAGVLRTQLPLVFLTDLTCVDYSLIDWFIVRLAD